MANVDWLGSSLQRQMGNQLRDIKRCPHCSIASPSFSKVWASQGPTPRTDGGQPAFWGAYLCSACGGAVVVRGSATGAGNSLDEIYPREKNAHADIPPVARTFLQQAYETLHAPDAATVMAASAVDAMLKEKSYQQGSLYTRIDKALADNVLTQGMADWAHSVRLEANSVRHSDQARPHATPEEARQTVEFAEALGTFLFVLTAKVERGIKDATGTQTTQ